jgi:hypothetical protein
MPVDTARLQPLLARTVDLVTEDGAALVVMLHSLDTDGGEAQIAVEVLAVEQRGTGRQWKPGESGLIPVRDVKSVRPVIFLTGSGM